MIHGVPFFFRSHCLLKTLAILKTLECRLVVRLYQVACRSIDIVLCGACLGPLSSGFRGFGFDPSLDRTWSPEADFWSDLDVGTGEATGREPSLQGPLPNVEDAGHVIRAEQLLANGCRLELCGGSRPRSSRVHRDRCSFRRWYV